MFSKRQNSIKTTECSVTYLRRNVFPFSLCDRVSQGDRRRIDKITLPLGHSQMNTAVRPCLYVEISIPRLDFGIGLERVGMRGIFG